MKKIKILKFQKLSLKDNLKLLKANKKPKKLKKKK